MLVESGAQVFEWWHLSTRTLKSLNVQPLTLKRSASIRPLEQSALLHLNASARVRSIARQTGGWQAASLSNFEAFDGAQIKSRAGRHC